MNIILLVLAESTEDCKLCREYYYVRFLCI